MYTPHLDPLDTYIAGSGHLDCFYVLVFVNSASVNNAVPCFIAQSCLTLCNPMYCSLPGSSIHRDSPHKNTGMGSHSLLQRSFLTQGWNPGLLPCRRILYHLSHQGSPIIPLEFTENSYPSHIYLEV